MSDEAKQTQFTPPPWEYRNGYVYHRNATDRAGRAKSYAICGVSLPGANEMLAATGAYGSSAQAEEIRDANARLIAAAPALYDRLKDVLQRCLELEVFMCDNRDRDHDGDCNCEGDKGWAALALVDGTQPKESE